MFSALKSSLSKFTEHCHIHQWRRFTSNRVTKFSVSQAAKPVFHRNSNEFFCLSAIAPYSYHLSRGNLSFQLVYRVVNYRNIQHLGQLTPKQFVLSAARTFSTSACRLAVQRSGLGSSNKTGLIYIVAVFIFMLGGAYAGVPLYKVFCQATGLGGQAVQGHDTSNIETMEKVERPIVVRFNADVASSMRWNFRPQQTEVTVFPGETALAFYTAKNPTDKAIIGISTYNIIPNDAGQYFNKIQCFCFEEQRLNPNEQVDMPVFFYIDPEFAEDPKLEHVNTIMLSYTFFEAREGLQLPFPGYPQSHGQPIATAS
jgi:cytochrome c oxidase assembly protein subunit 11